MTTPSDRKTILSTVYTVVAVLTMGGQVYEACQVHRLNSLGEPTESNWILFGISATIFVAAPIVLILLWPKEKRDAVARTTAKGIGASIA